jgi:hypothetical protein
MDAAHDQRASARPDVLAEHGGQLGAVLGVDQHTGPDDHCSARSVR